MDQAVRQRLLLWSPLLFVGVLAAAPAFEDAPTVCPFALVTGTACPGCGMTRAAGYLLRGDFTTALNYHPLVPLVSAAALGGWVWFVLRSRGLVQPLSNRVLNVVLIAIAVGLMAVWIVRLTTGSLPPV